jgi:hypothetical protein
VLSFCCFFNLSKGQKGSEKFPFRKSKVQSSTDQEEKNGLDLIID